VTQRTYTYHILHNFPIKKMNRQVSEGTYFQESVIQSAQNHIFATTMPRGGRVPIEHNEALQLVQNCSAFSYDSSVDWETIYQPLCKYKSPEQLHQSAQFLESMLQIILIKL
jgi:hypothetical protein